MSHSGSSFGYRCIAVTAIYDVCVFVQNISRFPVETSGAIDMSRCLKISVKSGRIRFHNRFICVGVDISIHVLLTGGRI